MAERAPRGPRRRARRWVRLAAWAGAGLLALTLLARLLRAQGWAFDMVGMFAAQEAWAALGLGLVALLLRARWAGIALLAVGLTHWLWLGAIPRAPWAGASAPTDRVVSVLTFNAYAENPHHDLVMRTVAESGADIAIVLEASLPLSEEMGASSELAGIYPYRSLPEHGKWWSVCIFSKWPLHEMDLRREHREEWQRIKGNYAFVRSAVVDRPGTPFVVSAMWPDSPRSAARWREGNRETVETAGVVADHLAALGYPIVIGADMNASPPGYRTALMERLSGLRRAKPWLTPRGTWPSRIPSILRVAIDDLLVSNSIHVVSWKTLERRTGSDHVPVLVRLALPSGGAAEGDQQR